MTQLNCIASCSYSRECPQFDFSNCSKLEFMSNCSKLNNYLIKSSPEDRYEHIDYSDSYGLKEWSNVLKLEGSIDPNTISQAKIEIDRLRRAGM